MENKENHMNGGSPNFSGIFKKYSFIIYLILLILIIILAVWIRTLNISDLKTPDGNLTLAPDLDPFLYLRIAREFIQYGHQLSPDMMRSAPIGAPPYWTLNIYGIIGVYNLLNLFSHIPLEYIAIIFPVICFAAAVLIFFLLVQKLFEFLGKNKSSIIALISSLFLAVIPQMLHRTVAGVPEHESPGIALFFLAFYFFICSWKSESSKKSMIFAVLSGVATAAMALTWGGYRFIFMTFALAMLLSFLFNKTKKREIIIYFIWMITSFLIMFFSGKFLISFFLTSWQDIGFTAFVALILIVDILCKRIKEKFNKIPGPIISLLIGILAMIIIVLIIKPSFLINLPSQFVNSFINPSGIKRISVTVAENKAAYFSDVIGSFGFLTWTFILGTLLIFYETIKNFNKKEKISLNLAFIFLILATIFSRISSQNVLNGENAFSLIFYFGGILSFLFTFCSVYFRADKQKDKTLDDFKSIDFSYIFLLSFIIFMIISMRGAIRIFFLTSSAIIIPSTFLVIQLIDYAIKSKDELQRILKWSAFFIICLMLGFAFVSYTQATYNETKGTIPGLYENQWYYAMKWVKENTPKDSIFAHWWDYGYWVQTLGERPTIVDGGQNIGYWNYLVGRHVLTAQNEQEALEFLYAHNTSYLLIDSTDIGKYPAYSSIGSDKNYDRLSSIGTFWIDEKSTQEGKNETFYVYVGGWNLDEDIIWEGQLYPSGKAGIGALMLPVRQENNSFAIEQPEAVLIYQNKQVKIPIKYLFLEGKKYEFENGIENAMYVMPRISETGMNKIGGALYIGKRGLNTLWVNLYLLNKSENFELVHSEGSLLISSVNQQQNNFNIGDFLMYGNGVYGPIKIWKINYPENFTISEEMRKDYLSKENPSLGFEL